MDALMYVMIGSGLLTLVCFGLFKAEAARGRRLLLGSVRDRLDVRLVESIPHSWRRYRNAISMRLLLHYLLHQLLNLALFINKKVEKGLGKLRHRNRIIAKDAAVIAPDNHLAHIARHREETALTEAEKQDLKDRTLHD